MNRNQKDLDEALPVRIVRTPEELTSLAVEYGGTSNFAVPQIGTANPMQILQRRPTRLKAIISVASLVTSLAALNQIPLGATGVASFNNNPVGVNQTITGGTVTAIAINGTTTGLTSGTFFVPAGGTVTVTYSVAPTVATTLPAGVTIPGSAATSVVIAHRQDYLANANNPQGFIIATTPFTFNWESQQPAYCMAIGGGPVTVSVIDQAQAASGSISEEDNQSAGMTVESQEEGGRYDDRDAGNQY